MGVFEMVVIIVFIGCGTGVLSEYMKTQRRKMANVQNDDLEDAMDRIDELEERTKVLEKIVTDGRYDLSRQIDELKK